MAGRAATEPGAAEATAARLCWRCRRVLVASGPCHLHDQAAIADLGDPDRREELARFVHGTASARAEARWAWLGRTMVLRGGQLLALTGSFALALMLLVGHAGLPSLGFLLLLMLGLAPFVVIWLGVSDRSVLAKRGVRRVERLRAGAPDPPLLTEGHGLRGKITSPAAMQAPASGRPCVAYSLALRHRDADGDGVMLRDAQTAGFEVELDDGERVLVLAGPIDLLSEAPGASAHGEGLERHLAALDPLRERADERRDPIPFDGVDEHIVGEGVIVEVCGVVERVADPAAPASGYRDAPATILVFRGVPTIIVVEPRS